MVLVSEWPNACLAKWLKFPENPTSLFQLLPNWRLKSCLILRLLLEGVYILHANNPKCVETRYQRGVHCTMGVYISYLMQSENIYVSLVKILKSLLWEVKPYTPNWLVNSQLCRILNFLPNLLISVVNFVKCHEYIVAWSCLLVWTTRLLNYNWVSTRLVWYTITSRETVSTPTNFTFERAMNFFVNSILTVNLHFKDSEQLFVFNSFLWLQFL